MNKRFIAMLLVLAMLAGLAGCKNATDSDLGTLEGGATVGGSEQNDENPSDQPNSQTPAGKDPAGSEKPSKPADPDSPQSEQKPSGSQGEQNTQKPSNNTQKPDTSEPVESTDKLPALTKVYKADEAIAVKAGEKVWFGPAATSQAVQLVLDGAEVGTSALQKVATFGNGYVIYCYTASAAGNVTVKASRDYKKLMLAAKQEMNMENFYQYWDNQKDRNLYDVGLDKYAKAIDREGALKKSEDYYSTHAIPVAKGDTLTFGPARSGEWVLAYGYDSAMKPVKLINAYKLPEAFVYTNGMRAYTYKVPEGVSYVRFNIPEAQREEFCVTKNDPFNASDYTRYTGVRVTEVSDPLYERLGLFLGDSICAAGADPADGNGLRGWAQRVAKESSMTCINAGISGAALSNCRLGRANATEQHQISNQLNKYKREKVDYILIHGGVNDAWDDVPLGEITDGFDPVFNTSTYAGGLEMAIYEAVRQHGDRAAIGYLINFESPNHEKSKDSGKYFEVGKKICEKWGILYLDLFAIDFDTTVYTDDGIHPNKAGYDVLGPHITDFMRTMTPCSKEALDAVKES